MAQVLPVEITEELKQSFINYAMSVIVDRALPTFATGSSRSKGASSSPPTRRGSSRGAST
jgi:hypothetical protein